jgi:hypothetical protein
VPVVPDDEQCRKAAGCNLPDRHRGRHRSVPEAIDWVATSPGAFRGEGGHLDAAETLLDDAAAALREYQTAPDWTPEDLEHTRLVIALAQAHATLAGAPPRGTGT